MGYHSRIPVHKPLLSNTNITRRLQWAIKHQHWIDTKWRTVGILNNKFKIVYLHSIIYNYFLKL